MDDAYDDALFEQPGDVLPDDDERDERYVQEGPDLFGAEPDELILPEPPPPAEPAGEPMEAEELAITDTGDDSEDAEEETDADPTAPTGREPDEPVVAPAAATADTAAAAAAATVGEGRAASPAPAHSAPAAPATPDRPEAQLALYRRYRPDTFAEVIGQEHVTEPLQRALENNRVSHAYLFSGPRGCGKTTSARILARCLNCEKGPTATPCGACRSCRELARGGGGSIDVIEIDAASHGGVDEARDLRERAFFAPVASRYKIYIIDEAHMVTTQGFNALLKVVEEPPPHVKFVFATTEPDKVIGTIRSRTHHYPFRLVPPKTLTGYLASLCEAEGVSVDHAVLPLVVRAGAGSVRDSLSVLDQLLGGAGPHGVEYTHAARLLGYTPDSLLDEIMDAFAAGDASGVFACIDKVIEVGQDPRRFAEDLLRRLRDLIIVAAVPDALATGLVDVADDQAERLTTQASGMGSGELTRAAEVIAQGLTDMRGTTAPRLHLELMCSRVLLPGADVDGRGVHARLDRLERRLGIPTDAGASASAAPVGYPGPSAPAEVETVPPATPRPAAPPPVADDRPVPEDPWAEPARPRTATAPANTQPPGPRVAEQGYPRPQGSAAEPRPSPAASPPPQPGQVPAPAASTDAPAAEAAEPGRVTTADVRAMWPQVLDEVKNRRRVTWIILREQAQVHEYADGVLTLAMNNPGARESFNRGGSPDILREAVLEVLGVAATIETLALDADPGPRAEPPPAASVPAPPRPREQPDRPSPAQQARENIRPTQLTPTEPEAEEEGSRDDVDLDDGAVDTEELMTKYLGAELLGEEEPDA